MARPENEMLFAASRALAEKSYGLHMWPQLTEKVQCECVVRAVAVLAVVEPMIRADERARIEAKNARG